MQFTPARNSQQANILLCRCLLAHPPERVCHHTWGQRSIRNLLALRVVHCQALQKDARCPWRNQEVVTCRAQKRKKKNTIRQPGHKFERVKLVKGSMMRRKVTLQCRAYGFILNELSASRSYTPCSAHGGCCTFVLSGN